MMGEFDTYLRNTGIPLKLRQRDVLLAKILFDKTPNEVYQCLSRSESVPIDWTAGEPHMLSIWPRVKFVMHETGLNDDQLKIMVSNILAKVFHKLELSMQSAIFQIILGMKILPIEADQCVFPNKMAGKLLKFDRFYNPRPPYMQSVFNDHHYEPSSASQRYLVFDWDTHEIVLHAYRKAVNIAENKAILSSSEVSLLADDLESVRNSHLAALVLQPSHRLIQSLQNYLIDYFDSNIKWYETPIHEEGSTLFHWWEGIDLQSSILWFRASMAMGFKIVPDYLIDDILRENDNSELYYKITSEFHEFNKIFTRHLEEIGSTVNSLLKEGQDLIGFISDDYYYIFESKTPITFPEAIKIAYKKAYEEYTSIILRNVRLITRMDNNHEIYSLLPFTSKKG